MIGSGKEREGSSVRKPVTSYVITVLLLLLLIVAGMAVYNVRQEWWDTYLGPLIR